MNPNNFPALLERFFSQRLVAQRQASPHTIASYRDTFRLLLQFAEKRLHKRPSSLSLSDLQPALIGAFLDELEKTRGNTARSRNLRLTAIRSFFNSSRKIHPYLAIRPKENSRFSSAFLGVGVNFAVAVL